MKKVMLTTNTVRKIPGIFFMLLIIALGGTGWIFLRAQRPAVVSERFDSYRELHAAFNQVVARRGIGETLDMVRDTFIRGNITINECHSLLHQLGHAAYEFHRDDWNVLTLEKTRLCMDGFAHGVEAQMAMEWPLHAERVRDDLRRYCKEMRALDQSWSCYHGAGHAFIQRYGNDAPIALSKCDEAVPQEDEAEDCWRGVFSEYRNFLNAYDGDNEAPIPGMTPKTIPVSETFYECAAVPSKYHDACISQFAGYLITDDLDASVATCLTFGDWVWRRCIQTVASSFVANTFAQTNVMMPVKALSSFTVSAREGFIDGMYEGLVGFQRSDFATQWDMFCSALGGIDDQAYCRSKVL